MKTNRIKILSVVRYFSLFCVIAMGLMAIIATGGDGGVGSNGGGTGTLSLGLTDATTDEFQAVYVTIQEVSVHKGEGSDESDEGNDGDETNSWEVVVKPNKTYNLLELVNGVIEQLGVGELEAGHYTQMRLLLGETADEEPNILGESHPFPNYVINESGVINELKVPSGYQSGIKLVHGFDIQSGVTTELVLDFDAQKSVVITGGGKYLLKPTIKVIDTVESSTMSGTVTIGTDPIEGASVSAQVYDGSATDVKDEVFIQASTITDENGEYKMILEAGTYNIVVYKDDYSPECTNIVLESGTDLTDEDFTLTGANTGTVSGYVEIKGGGDEDIATLSFRQECGGEQIEVKSLNVVNKDTYSDETLPEGTYDVVASAEGKVTQQSIEGVTDGDNTDLGNIILEDPVP